MVDKAVTTVVGGVGQPVTTVLDKSGDPQWWQCCVRKFQEFRCCFQMCYTPSLFGVMTREKSALEERRKQQRQGGQGGPPLSLSQMFGMAGSGYTGSSHRLSADRNLVLENGSLLSGSLESLIAHLLPTADYYAERTYIFAFLLSSRVFIRPHHLFAQICQLSGSQQPVCGADSSVKRESLGRLNTHILRLIGDWADLLPYDFREERMMTHLRDVTQRLLTLHPETKRDVSAIMQRLLTKLSRLEAYESSLARLAAELLQKSHSHAHPTTDIVEVCPSAVVLAQQLTHIELERLSMIGPEEFIQAFCKEKRDSDAYAEMKRTSNLEAYVQWFNHLSYVVASEICSHLKRRNRVRVLEYFTDVAKECINLGNFNSLMAIIAGMNMNPVARLKKTWLKVNRSKVDMVERQMDPSNNFGTYRACLKAALGRARSAASDKEKVVIPFFSLFIKDLYFLNEGCTTRQPDGNINFEKCWTLAKHVSDLITWQQVECPYTKNSRVINYVQTLPVFSEATLSLASYECEGPESSYDRERHKHLKSQAGL